MTGFGPLRILRQQVRKPIGALALFSCVINLLLLTGPLFMLQVYDRVLSSGSVQTLVALVILVVVLFAFMGRLTQCDRAFLPALPGVLTKFCVDRSFLQFNRMRGGARKTPARRSRS